MRLDWINTRSNLQDVVRRRSKEGWRRAEMVAMRKAYGIEQRTNYRDDDMQPYNDRANKRRRKVAHIM